MSNRYEHSFPVDPKAPLPYQQSRVKYRLLSVLGNFQQRARLSHDAFHPDGSITAPAPNHIQSFHRHRNTVELLLPRHCLEEPFLHLHTISTTPSLIPTSNLEQETHPPRIVQLEAQRRHHLIRLPSQKSRQASIAIHHFWCLVSKSPMGRRPPWG